MTHDVPLELDGAAFRDLVNSAADRLAIYIDTLPEQKSWDLDGAAEVARSVRRPLPARGRPIDAIFDELFDRYVPVGFNTAGPGYLAYIPGGGIPSAAVGDLIADIVNRFAAVWTAAPALAQIETEIVRWFCGIVDYPAGSGGFLTTGGSMANFSAIVAARQRWLGASPADGVMYVSSQGHHSLQKSAALAGIPATHVRALPVDAKQRIVVDAVAPAVAEDRAAGRRPFFLCGNAGTTSTGAVDDLPALADIARQLDLWYHIDAAYGGFFALTERGRVTLRGIGAADSVTLDPHKGLFLPYGTGCLLARDPATLRAAHSVAAAYLPSMQSDPDFVDYCEITPELSRDFRGLRLWLPILLHGIDAFRAALDEKLDLATEAAKALRTIPHLELLDDPPLSLLAFRLVPPGLDDDATDRLNETWMNRVNDRRDVFITSTRIDGRVVVRICVLSFRTHADRVRACVDALIEEARSLSVPSA